MECCLGAGTGFTEGDGCALSTDISLASGLGSVFSVLALSGGGLAGSGLDCTSVFGGGGLVFALGGVGLTGSVSTFALGGGVYEPQITLVVVAWRPKV